MDILAHGLWTNAALVSVPNTRNQKKIIRWGIVFGVLPDLASFGPLFAYYVFQIILGKQTFFYGPPVHLVGTGWFDYASVSYNYSHSLIIWLAVLLAVWTVFRKFPWVLLGWGLHIAIDIFSHTSAFFPTPFLFPISNYQISAVNWSHPVFMAVNYGLLLVFYFLVLPKLKRTPESPKGLGR